MSNGKNKQIVNSSKIELKFANLIVEIILRNNLNHMELQFCENLVRKQSQHIIYSLRCFERLQNKIFYNFLVSYPNRMSQRFLKREKYYL